MAATRTATVAPTILDPKISRTFRPSDLRPAHVDVLQALPRHSSAFSLRSCSILPPWADAPEPSFDGAAEEEDEGSDSSPSGTEERGGLANDATTSLTSAKKSSSENVARSWERHSRHRALYSFLGRRDSLRRAWMMSLDWGRSWAWQVLQRAARAPKISSLPSQRRPGSISSKVLSSSCTWSLRTEADKAVHKSLRARAPCRFCHQLELLRLDWIMTSSSVR
mmetsp:Transcript_26262/g.45184  ORF Transcript_26262/g.45184 Transcript_26262/m.45184 type:complete len:223 (-) Transcript_26262:672-1340(-)